MDKKQQIPFPLTLVTIIYFVLGVSALGAFVAGKESDWLTMSLIIVAYGLVTNRLWGLVGLRVVVAMQLLFVMAMLGLSILPGKVSSSFGINGLELYLPSWVFYVILFTFVAFQFYVAFSKRISVHFYAKA